jgi:hypothetical protein
MLDNRPWRSVKEIIVDIDKQFKCDSKRLEALIDCLASHYTDEPLLMQQVWQQVLFVALAYHRHAIVKHFLSHDVRLPASDLERDILIYVLLHSDLDMLRILMDARISMSEPLLSCGVTPLMAAAASLLSPLEKI